MEDVATPLPKELHTPPETTIYFMPSESCGLKASVAGDGGGAKCRFSVSVSS